MSRRPPPLPAVLALVAVLPARGEEVGPSATAFDSLPAHPLPPIEVRADAFPDPLGPFPLTTSLLRRSALERRPGGDLREALLPVAGLRVTSLGASDAGSAVSIRGASTDQVLVLVDGSRRNPAQGGGVDLASLSLDTVESVEVFRGGASALWGSAAIGGAIHVRTRRPRPGSARVRVAAGSFGERRVEGSTSFDLGRGWGLRTSGRAFRTDGDYAFLDDHRRTETVVTNGDILRLGGEVRAEGPAGGSSRARIDASAVTTERGVPGSEEFPTPRARLTDDRGSLGIRWERRGTAPWQPAAELTWLGMERRYTDPEAPFLAIDDSHRNVRVESGLSVDRMGHRSTVRLATGLSIDRLESTTDGSRRRDSGNLRAQLSRDLSWGEGRTVRGMLAARLDGVEGFAPHLSPRIGLLARVWPERLQFRASAGLSFRTPSFDELFWPPRASAAGNPDLRPERGRDVDIGVSIRGGPGSARIQADVFLREVDDLIQWVPGASGVWRPHNIGAARIAGVEIDGSVEAPAPGELRIRLGGSATGLHSEDRSGEPNVDGRRLVYRPTWAGALGITLARGEGHELEASWRFVDDVFVTRANTKSLEGHVFGDIRYRRRMGLGLRIDASVTNVTDVTARDVRDFPLPGRAWKLGITYERSAS